MREMDKIRGKTGTSSIPGRFKRTFLRLYRAEPASQDPLVGQKTVGYKAAFADSYHGSQIEIRRAMIQAEHNRALALMERQKHQHLC